MEQVKIKVAHTKNGYSAACDLLKGWIVSYDDDFSTFKCYVKDSINFYIDCAKKDRTGYPTVFDGDYELVYDITNVNE